MDQNLLPSYFVLEMVLYHPPQHWNLLHHLQYIGIVEFPHGVADRESNQHISITKHKDLNGIIDTDCYDRRNIVETVISPSHKWLTTSRRMFVYHK